MNNDDKNYRPNIDRRPRQSSTNNNSFQTVNSTNQSPRKKTQKHSNSTDTHRSTQEQSFNIPSMTKTTQNRTPSQMQSSNNGSYYSSQNNKSNNNRKFPKLIIFITAIIVLIVVVAISKSCTSSKSNKKESSFINTDISSDDNHNNNENNSSQGSSVKDTSNFTTYVTTTNREESLTTSTTVSITSKNEITVDSIAQITLPIEPIVKSETTIVKATIETIPGTDRKSVV